MTPRGYEHLCPLKNRRQLLGLIFVGMFLKQGEIFSFFLFDVLGERSPEGFDGGFEFGAVGRELLELVEELFDLVGG